MKKFNCCPNLDKQINIPSRKELLPILEDLGEEIVDVVIPLDELLDKIGFYLVDRFRIDVMHATSNIVPLGSMNINAEYDKEKDAEGKPSIQIYLVTHPIDKTFLWDRENFEYFTRQLADIIIHELAHMHQSRMRNFKDYHVEKEHFETDKEVAQYYLSHYDEIDASAYNIANELNDLKEFINIKKYFVKPTNIKAEISVSLWAYIQTFDKNINNPAIKRLLKKVYKHFTSLK